MKDENQNELNNDNTRLEELFKCEMTPLTQLEILNEIKKSELIMPVVFPEEVLREIDSSDSDTVEMDEAAFNIEFIGDEEDNMVVPLFTSDEKIMEAGMGPTAIACPARDIAELISQSDDFSSVAFNPFCENTVDMPVEIFLEICEDVTDEEADFIEMIDTVLDALLANSVSLEENSTFFYRADENIMVEEAEDGFFTPEIPFAVSSNPKYGEDLKYTNIIMVPESTRVLFGDSDEDLDIIIAPLTEFHLEDRLDDFTSLWMCGAQPFYDEWEK